MRVAVFGLGGVGLAAVIGARLAGAATIVGVDIDARTSDLAAELGATACIHGADGAAQRVRDASEGGVAWRRRRPG